MDESRRHCEVGAATGYSPILPSSGQAELCIDTTFNRLWTRNVTPHVPVILNQANDPFPLLPKLF